MDDSNVLDENVPEVQIFYNIVPVIDPGFYFPPPDYDNFFPLFGDLTPPPIPIDDVNATDNNSTIGIEDTLIRTGRIRNRMNSLYSLCGVPGVCNPSAIPSCLNVTVGGCDECSSTTSGFFVSIILI